MTYEDAKEWLANQTHYFQTMEEAKADQVFREVVNKALEKQIPLRANDIFCPICGRFSIIDGEYGDRFNYCYECGQKIDWSDEI